LQHRSASRQALTLIVALLPCAVSCQRHFVQALSSSTLLFPIIAGLSLLVRILREKLFSIRLEEPTRLHRVASRDVMKGQGGDVVGLAFANQRVVLEEKFFFGLVTLGVGVESSLCFGSVGEVGEGRERGSAGPKEHDMTRKAGVIRTLRCLRTPILPPALRSHLRQEQGRRSTWVLRLR
jgi:hypothetical protein